MLRLLNLTMSLRNSLYHITSHDGSAYTIRFNPDHPIFSGHFPGHPIVPGACLVQIAQELLSDQLGQPVRFTAIHNLQFRQPITPDMEVRYIIDEKITIEDLESTNYAQFATTYLCAHTDL